MVRKRMLNKRTVIVASSLAAIPLTAMIIAAAIHRRRRKSLETSRFSGQTRSKANVITTTTTTTAAVIDRQQQKEKSQEQLQPSSQGSETKAGAMTATAATISTNTTIATKEDITTTPAAVVPSPMGPSGNPDSAIITPSSSYQTPEEEEISVSDEAKKSGESLKELIVTAIKEAKDSAKGTGKRLKEQTINIAATTDSKDIHSLGDNVNALIGLFEETMIEIRKERYDQQIKLLDSYKDLLQKHIKVIDARGRMARKLKPGA
jgi:hypothetical protein